MTAGVDGTSSANCYGSTGDQVLDSLHGIYQAASSSDRIGRNSAIALGIISMYIVTYWFLLVKNSAECSRFETSDKSREEDVIRPSTRDDKASLTSKLDQVMSKVDKDDQQV
jgi:hypothetical protein